MFCNVKNLLELSVDFISTWSPAVIIAGILDIYFYFIIPFGLEFGQSDPLYKMVFEKIGELLMCLVYFLFISLLLARKASDLAFYCSACYMHWEEVWTEWRISRLYRRQWSYQGDLAACCFVLLSFLLLNMLILLWFWILLFQLYNYAIICSFN